MLHKLLRKGTEAGSDKNLRIPNLGDPTISLGALYDARRDTFLSGVKPWSPETISSLTQHQKPNQSNASIEKDSSFSQKATLLDLTPAMKLSFLCEKLKLDGSARYLADSKATLNTVSLTVAFSIFTRLDELFISRKIERHNLKEYSAATHLVTKVWYGACLFIVLYRERLEHEQEKMVMEELEMAAREVKRALINSEVDPMRRQLQCNTRIDYQNIKCRYYGDIKIDLSENFSEALEDIRRLSPENADTPVQVELSPLSQITGGKVWTKKLTDELITETADYIEVLNDAIISAQTLLDQISPTWQGQRERLNEFLKHFKTAKSRFCDELMKLLPEAQKHRKDSKRIIEHVTRFRDNSPFSPDQVRKWITNNEKECRILQSFASKLSNAGVIMLTSSAEKGRCHMGFDSTPLILYEVSFSRSRYSQTLKCFLEDGSMTEVRDFSGETWIDTPQHRQLDEVLKSVIDLRNCGIPVQVFWLSDAQSIERPIQVQELGRKLQEWSPWFPPDAPTDISCFMIASTETELMWKPVLYDFIAHISYQIDLCITDRDGLKVLRRSSVDIPAVFLTDLTPDTEYVVQVSTLTELGNSKPSDLFQFRTSKLMLCSTFVRDNLCEPEPIKKNEDEKFPGDIYQLKKLRIDSHNPCNCPISEGCLCPESFEVGVNSGSCDQTRFILVLGETGTGKTTFINAVANAFYGITYDDNFRFKLINEVSQAHSQTKTVSVYTLFPVNTGGNDKGCLSAMDCPLTVIDTPGFCDTRQKDPHVVKKIGRVLSDDGSQIPGMSGVLHAIGFVVKASQNKLTESQRYIFDQVLSFFGNDVEKIIYPVLTFSDIADDPLALGTLREFKVPCDVYFKYDNKVLYADNALSIRGQEDMQFYVTQENTGKWKMTWNSYADLFRQLRQSQIGVSLQSTRQVLLNRKMLEDAKEIFVKRVFHCLNKMTNLENEVHLIETLDTEIKEIDMSKAYTSIVMKREKRQLPAGKYAMMCTTCDATCHGSCNCGSSIFLGPFRKCHVFNVSGGCTVCPQRCWSSVHQKVDYYYYYLRDEELVSVRDILERQKKNTERRQDKEQVVQGLKEAINKEKCELSNDLARIHRCLEELERMALRSFPLTVGKYVDLMIKRQKIDQHRGWETRVKFLEEARESSGAPEAQSFAQELDMFSINVTGLN